MSYESVEDLIRIVDESVDNGKKSKSKITHEIEMLRGMSSPRIRHTLNNLCSYGPCNYFEIGSWGGSTFIPAVYKNQTYAVSIDNYSQFPPSECEGYDAHKDFQERLLKYGSDLGRYEINNCDCFAPLNLPSDFKPNVYFYDGAHDEEATEKAIKLFGKISSQNFILVVDDFELADSVKIGLSKGMLNFDIHKTWHLQKNDGYHMGVFIAVLSQR